MEYTENTQFKKIIFDLCQNIRDEGIKQNKKFDICGKTIANAVINPSKVSYIKKDKIESLSKYANVKITEYPTAEQRNKYFAACSITKFVNSYFDKNNINTEQLESFNQLVREATKAAAALLPKTFHVLDAEHIPTIYNQQHTDATTGNRSNTSEQKPVKYPNIETPLYLAASTELNSSCMQGKPQKYFEIYNDLNTDVSTLKMAILTQGNEIVARSLVWIDKATEDIDRRKKMQPNNIFIDRIYTKTQDHRAETQTQMFNEIHKYYKIDIKTTDNNIKFANCFNWYKIKSKVEAEQNTIKEIFCGSNPLFDVEVKRDSYDYYPYCDTYSYFNTYDQTLSNDQSSDSDVLKLDSIIGEASENTRSCHECGCEVDPDYINYIGSVEVCDDCCVYCDDREENILQSDAVYNNNTSEYHHRSDLDY